MSRFREIFFDCDGTLVDSEIIAMRIAGEVLADALKEKDPSFALDLDGFVQKYAGWHFDEMIRVTGENYGVSFDKSALGEEKNRRTLEGLKATQPVPGIYWTLNDLDFDRIDYSLVTSSEFSRVNLCLDVCSLSPFFPEARKFSAHDTLPVPAHKPKPDIYLYALAARGLAESDVAAVEDSLSGVKSAVAAGIFTIGYTGGSHIPATDKQSHARRLLDAGAAVVIADMTDLLLVIASADPAFVNRHAKGAVIYGSPPSLAVRHPSPPAP